MALLIGSKMEKPQYHKWKGIADWLIGRIMPETEIDETVEVIRIDGTICRVNKSSLQPATYDEVLLAIKLGGCTIPIKDK